MPTSTAADARAHARALIERALITPAGQGGLSAAIDQLEGRLRRYGTDLTADDLNDIKSYLVATLDPIYELLAPRAPNQVWSDTNQLGDAS
jgi:hypothetical protein